MLPYADESTVQSLLARLASAEHNVHRWGHDDAIRGLRGIVADALDDVGRGQEAQLLRTQGRHVLVTPEGVRPGRFSHQGHLNHLSNLGRRISELHPHGFDPSGSIFLIPPEGVEEQREQHAGIGGDEGLFPDLAPGRVHALSFEPFEVLQNLAPHEIGPRLADFLGRDPEYGPMAADPQFVEHLSALRNETGEEEDPDFHYARTNYALPPEDWSRVRLRLGSENDAPDFDTGLTGDGSGMNSGFGGTVGSGAVGGFNQQWPPQGDWDTQLPNDWVGNYRPLGYGLADQRGFEEAITANPLETTNHGVYGDWLEEQGLPEEANFRRLVGESVQRRLQNPWSEPQWSPDQGYLLQPNAHGPIDPFVEPTRAPGGLELWHPHSPEWLGGAGDWGWRLERTAPHPPLTGTYPDLSTWIDDRESRGWDSADLHPAERIYAGIDDLTTLDPALWHLVEQIMHQQHGRGLRFDDNDEPTDYADQIQLPNDWTTQYHSAQPAPRPPVPQYPHEIYPDNRPRPQAPKPPNSGPHEVQPLDPDGAPMSETPGPIGGGSFAPQQTRMRTAGGYDPRRNSPRFAGVQSGPLSDPPDTRQPVDDEYHQPAWEPNPGPGSQYPGSLVPLANPPHMPQMNDEDYYNHLIHKGLQDSGPIYDETQRRLYPANSSQMGQEPHWTDQGGYHPSWHPEGGKAPNSRNEQNPPPGAWDWAKPWKFEGAGAVTHYADVPPRMLTGEAVLPRLRRRKKGGYEYEDDEEALDYAGEQQFAPLFARAYSSIPGFKAVAQLFPKEYYGGWVWNVDEIDPHDEVLHGPWEQLPETTELAYRPLSPQHLWGYDLPGGVPPEPQEVDWMHGQDIPPEFRYARTEYADDINTDDYYRRHPLDTNAMVVAADWNDDNSGNPWESQFLREADPWIRDRLGAGWKPPAVGPDGMVPGGSEFDWPAVTRVVHGNRDWFGSFQPRQYPEDRRDDLNKWWWGSRGTGDGIETLAGFAQQALVPEGGNVGRQYLDAIRRGPRFHSLPDLTDVEKAYGGITDLANANPDEWAQIVNLMRQRKRELGRFEDDDEPVEYGTGDELRSQIAQTPLEVDPHLRLADWHREQGDEDEGAFREQVGRSVERRLRNPWTEPERTRDGFLVPGAHGPVDALAPWLGGSGFSFRDQWVPIEPAQIGATPWVWQAPWRADWRRLSGDTRDFGTWLDGRGNDIHLTDPERIYTGIDDLTTADPGLWKQVEAIMRQQHGVGHRFEDDEEPTEYVDREGFEKTLFQDPLNTENHRVFADFLQDDLGENHPEVGFRRALADWIDTGSFGQVEHPDRGREWVIGEGVSAPGGLEINSYTFPNVPFEFGHYHWSDYAAMEAALQGLYTDMGSSPPSQSETPKNYGPAEDEDSTAYGAPIVPAGFSSREEFLAEVARLSAQHVGSARIAKILGIAPGTVRDLVAKLPPDQRLPAGTFPQDVPAGFEDWGDFEAHVKYLTRFGMSLKDIASHLGVPQSTARKFFVDVPSAERNRGGRTGQHVGGRQGRELEEITGEYVYPFDLSETGPEGHDARGMSRNTQMWDELKDMRGSGWHAGTTDNPADESYESIAAQVGKSESTVHRRLLGLAKNGPTTKELRREMHEESGLPILPIQSMSSHLSRYGSAEDEESFRQAIDENPEELTTHGAYADWLEEQGDRAGDVGFRRALMDWFPVGAHEHLPARGPRPDGRREWPDDFGRPDRWLINEGYEGPGGWRVGEDTLPEGWEWGYGYHQWPTYRAMEDALRHGYLNRHEVRPGTIPGALPEPDAPLPRGELPVELSRYAALPRDGYGHISGVMQPVSDSAFLEGHFGPKQHMRHTAYGDREALEGAIVQNPWEGTIHGELADWHDEFGSPEEAGFRRKVMGWLPERLGVQPEVQERAGYQPWVLGPNPEKPWELRTWGRSRTDISLHTLSPRRGDLGLFWGMASSRASNRDPEMIARHLGIPVEEAAWRGGRRLPEDLYTGGRSWTALNQGEEEYLEGTLTPETDPAIWPQIEAILRERHRLGQRFEDDDEPTDYSATYIPQYAGGMDGTQHPLFYPPCHNPEEPLQYDPMDYGLADDEAAMLRTVHQDPFDVTGHLALSDWYGDQGNEPEQNFRRLVGESVQRRLQGGWSEPWTDRNGYLHQDPGYGPADEYAHRVLRPRRPETVDWFDMVPAQSNNVTNTDDVMNTGFGQPPEDSWIWERRYTTEGVRPLDTLPPYGPGGLGGEFVGDLPTLPEWQTHRGGSSTPGNPFGHPHVLRPEEQWFAGIQEPTALNPGLWALVEQIMRQQHGRGLRFEDDGGATEYGLADDEAGFRQKIEENPYEINNHLAFADWLEEQGQGDNAQFRKNLAQWIGTQEGIGPLEDNSGFPWSISQEGDLPQGVISEDLPMWDWEPHNIETTRRLPGGGFRPVNPVDTDTGWDSQRSGNPFFEWQTYPNMEDAMYIAWLRGRGVRI